MKNILRNTVILALIVVFSLPACKSEEGFSNYLIVPQRENQQPEEGAESDFEVPQDLVTHIFMDVKGTGWKALSYEDAERGILTDTVGGIHETLEANATFGQDEVGNVEIGSLQGGRKHFLIACDRESGVYAWRELRTSGDAGTIFLRLVFRPWRVREQNNATYTEYAWTMVNPLTEPEPEPEPEPESPE